MKNFFPAVDGLRGFLALYVFAFHLGTRVHFDGALSWINIFLKYGVLSPSYFFVISGFLIFNSYKKNEHIGSSRIKNFYIGRLFRILPALWVTVFIFRYIYMQPTGWNMISTMFLFFGFFPYDYSKLTVFIAWSLFVEECFYICTPLIARLKTIKGVFFGFFFFLTTAVIWLSLEERYHFLNGLKYHTPFSFFHFFFAGIIIYYLYIDTKTDFKKLSKYLLVGIDFSLVLLLLLQFSGQWIPTFLIGSLFLLTALMDGSFLQFLWRNPVLKWAGVRCYCIYLVHAPIVNHPDLGFIKKIIVLFPDGNLKSAVTFLLYTIYVLLCSEILHQLVEKPFINFGKKLFPIKLETKPELSD